MPSLTVKNIPETLLQHLKAAAQVHRRSLNSEVIVLLETALAAARPTREEHLERARRCRELTRVAGIHATTATVREAIDKDRV
jgi:plasmid stability protein